jgi:hypothetical protein
LGLAKHFRLFLSNPQNFRENILRKTYMHTFPGKLEDLAKISFYGLTCSPGCSWVKNIANFLMYIVWVMLYSLSGFIKNTRMFCNSPYFSVFPQTQAACRAPLLLLYPEAADKAAFPTKNSHFSQARLKGPMLQIFGSGIFTQIRPVWVGDLGIRLKNPKLGWFRHENRRFVFLAL